MLRSLRLYLKAMGKGLWAVIMSGVVAVLGLVQGLVDSGVVSPVFDSPGLPAYVWWLLAFLGIAIGPFVAFHKHRDSWDGTPPPQTPVYVGGLDRRELADSLGRLREDGVRLFADRSVGNDAQLADWLRKVERWEDAVREVLVDNLSHATLQKFTSLGPLTAVDHQGHFNPQHNSALIRLDKRLERLSDIIDRINPDLG